MRRNVRKERAYKQARGWSFAGQRDNEPMPKVQPREERRHRMTLERATLQVSQENISCASCPGLALENEKFCLHCKLYWADVDDGMFYTMENEND